MTFTTRTIKVSSGWYAGIVSDATGREVSQTADAYRSPRAALAAANAIRDRLAVVAMRNAAKLPNAFMPETRS